MEIYGTFLKFIKIIVQSSFVILYFVEVNGDLESEIHALDKFIKETVSCRKIPGLSISLVRDGHVIMSRGYGYADIERELKASEHTKFCMGSLTKAFTTTIIADVLSKQDRITWDTPVKEIFGPCFRLSNDLLTNNVNLRDLLAHKVGTPPYFHALFVGFPKKTTRKELIRRLQYMPATEPFRTKFKYSNYMYTLGAHVAEILSNESWEKLVTDRLFVPLGMRNTGLLHKTDSLRDIARHYTLKNNRLLPIDTDLTLAVSPLDPAGAIYSSATDMSKWMLFHLNNGRNAHGRRLVNDTWLNQTYEPQMALPFSPKDMYKPVYPVEDAPASYGLGWITSTYRGYRKIWHSGGIVTHKSRLWLFPDMKSGVFVVVSGPLSSQGSLAIQAVSSRAADLVLQEEPWLNTTTTCTLPEPWYNSTKQVHPNPDYIVFKWNISKNQHDYAGVYSHKGFGNITVYAENNSTLFLLFGRFGKMHLQPVSEAHFSGYYMEKLWYSTGSDEHNNPIKIEFNIDEHTNKVSGVLFPVDFGGPLTLFERDLNFDWTSGRKAASTSNSDCASGIKSSTAHASILTAVVLHISLFSLFSILR